MTMLSIAEFVNSIDAFVTINDYENATSHMGKSLNKYLNNVLTFQKWDKDDFFHYKVKLRDKTESFIIDLNLLKSSSSGGSKKVKVLPKHHNENGAIDSRSVFFLRQTFADLSMLDVKLVTGRTHQIRVHLSHLGFPIVGDDKYGNFSLNKYQKKIGFKRMFLHASELGFVHPLTEKSLLLSAPLPKEFIELQEYAKKH